MVTELLGINDRLRRCLSQLESTLSVQFTPAEIDRVFSDSIADQVSEKEYNFFESDRMQVRGVVDDHEPYDIWVSVAVTRKILCRVTANRKVEDRCRQILQEFVYPY